MANDSDTAVSQVSTDDKDDQWMTVKGLKIRQPLPYKTYEHYGGWKEFWQYMKYYQRIAWEWPVTYLHGSLSTSLFTNSLAYFTTFVDYSV